MTDRARHTYGYLVAKAGESLERTPVECDIYDERGHLVGYTTLSLTDQQLARLNQPDDQHSTY